MNGNRKRSGCKLETAFIRTLMPEKQDASSSSAAEEPGGSNIKGMSSGMWRIESTSLATESKRSNNIDDKRKIQKDEYILHLICWGPSWP